jgi:hypothetical protein
MMQESAEQAGESMEYTGEGSRNGKNRITDSGHFTRTIAVSKGGSNKLHKTLATWHKKV